MLRVMLFWLGVVKDDWNVSDLVFGICAGRGRVPLNDSWF